MDFSKCNFECELVRTSLIDENNNYKIYTSNTSKYPFQIRILDIFPIQIENEFSVGIKTERLDTLEIKEMEYKVFKEFYF